MALKQPKMTLPKFIITMDGYMQHLSLGREGVDAAATSAKEAAVAALNPDSLLVAKGYAEPALMEDKSGIAVQFERTGYYVLDKDSTPEHPVFNKTTALKDSYKPE